MDKVKFCIIVLGVLICTSSAAAQKIEQFTDSKGTVHIGTPPDAKPGNNTNPEVKPKAKPEDETKPEAEKPFQRKILPKSQRVSRRPMGPYPPGEFPPGHQPSQFQRPAVKPQPAKPELPEAAPGPEGGQKAATP